MAILTKLTKARNDYQVWDQTELSAGDIIDIETSLGHAARFITIESDAGDTVIRFNVVKKVFANHKDLGNDKFLGPDVGFWTSAYLLGEIEQANPDITISTGQTQNWRDGEIAVKDIKIVLLAPTTRIIVS